MNSKSLKMRAIVRPEFEGKSNSILHKGCRFASRVILRLFNLSGTYKIIKLIKLLQKYIPLSILKYFYYYLYSRFLQKKYLFFLSECNFMSAIDVKIRWANLVLRSSSYEYEKYAACDYIKIMSKYGLTESTSEDICVDDFTNNPNHRKSEVEKVFYLYGPNSEKPPNPKYKNCTLVVTKDSLENVDHFEDSILFINKMYYNKIKNNKKKKDEILKKYGRVLINSMHFIDDENIEYSEIPPGSELCGLMGFGRVLYNLIFQHGRINCIIEGYDMYTTKTPYSEYYPSLTRVGKKLDEGLIVQGLADHDFIYDFLKVKELIKNVNLIDSDKFSEVINMPLNDYLENLSISRNFKLLSAKI